MFNISTITNTNTNQIITTKSITNPPPNLPQFPKKKLFIFPSSVYHKKDLYLTSSQNGRWSKEEHNKFVEAIILYGSDWKKVQKYIATRNGTQARSHAQKFLMKLRNCDMIKKRNIKLDLGWAKCIQIIKNEFNTDELYKLFHSVSKKRMYMGVKVSKKKNLLNSETKNKDIDFYDDVSTIVSISTENNSVVFYNKKRNNEIIDWNEEIKTNKQDCNDKKECFRTFMENFKTRKISYDLNDNDDDLYSFKTYDKVKES